MEFKTFVRAVLDTHFSGTKDEIIESATKAICNYTGQPIIKNEGKTIQFSKPKFKDEEEIKVGDEVVVTSVGFKGIVLSIYSNERYRVIYKDGIISNEGKNTLKRTGRHFDELQQLLDKMKE